MHLQLRDGFSSSSLHSTEENRKWKRSESFWLKCRGSWLRSPLASSVKPGRGTHLLCASLYHSPASFSAGLVRLQYFETSMSRVLKWGRIPCYQLFGRRLAACWVQLIVLRMTGL